MRLIYGMKVYDLILLVLKRNNQKRKAEIVSGCFLYFCTTKKRTIDYDKFQS